MLPADEASKTMVARWIGKADTDYRTAERLIRDAGLFREPIAFHCQQAAEKYLKAFLVSRRVEFAKTHDLRHLATRTRDAIMPELKSFLAGP